MVMKIKSDFWWIGGIVALFFALNLIPHPNKDLKNSEKETKTSVQQSVSKPIEYFNKKGEKIPQYYRVKWGESLSDIAKKYFDCEYSWQVENNVKKIQKLNWDDAEISRRDIYEVRDEKLVSGKDGLADVVYFLESIKLR